MSTRSYFCVVSLKSGSVVSRHVSMKLARRAAEKVQNATISEGSWAVGEDVTRGDTRYDG